MLVKSGVKIDVKKNTKVLFEGIEIGEVSDKSVINDKEVLLELSINKNAIIHNDVSGIYAEDLLGNSYVELIKITNGKLPKKNINSNDTLVGKYRPLFEEVDTATKRKLIEEIKVLKNKLDTIIKKH